MATDSTSRFKTALTNVHEEVNKKRYIAKIQTRTQSARKMFTSFLFCSCFVAFLSTGSVSTNSQVLDYATYSNLLALLTGNTEIASPAEQSPYLRRLPQQQRKYFRNIVALIVKQIKHFLLTFFLNRSSKTLLCKPCHRLPSIILPRVSAATIF